MSLLVAVSESYGISPKKITVKESMVILRVESSESSTGSSPSSIASSVNISIASIDMASIQISPFPTPPQPKTSTINISVASTESCSISLTPLPVLTGSIVLSITESETAGGYGVVQLAPPTGVFVLKPPIRVISWSIPSLAEAKPVAPSTISQNLISLVIEYIIT